jgi:uncharacterized protein YjcR
MVLESEADMRHGDHSAARGLQIAVASIAEKFGCSSGTPRGWTNKQGIADGDRDGLTQS